MTPPRAPMPLREAISGRAVQAWWRAYAARAGWVGRYVRAGSWPVRFPGFDASFWIGSPFGGALDDVLSSRDVPSRPHRPQRPRVPGSLATTPAVPRRLVARAEAGKSGPTETRAARQAKPAPVRMPRASLARLAGHTVAAKSAAQTARRQAKTFSPTAPVRRLGRVAPPLEANASLGKRLERRMMQHVAPIPPRTAPHGGTRPTRQAALAWRSVMAPVISPQGFSGLADSRLRQNDVRARAPLVAGPSAWRRPIGPPPDGVFVEAPQGLPAASTGPRRATPGMMPSGAAPLPVVAEPVRPASLPPRRGRDAPQPVAPDAGHQEAPALAPRPFVPAPGAASSHRAMTEAVLARPFDAVDFAAQLRATLLEDARRHGIEV